MSETISGADKLPLFYRAPRPVDAVQHQHLKLATPNAAFAATASSIPVGLSEIPQIARSYPIVFPADGSGAVAVVGLRDNENLFVNASGHWREAVYVPAYVRRHPFIFLNDVKGRRLVLCIDEAAECLNETEGEPLFVEGQRSPALQAALEFTTAFQTQHDACVEFVAELARADLLVERDARITLNDGESRQVNGFRIVDEERLNAIPDDTFLDWRRKGWLGLLYCHLVSLNNWAGLVDLAASRKGTA